LIELQWVFWLAFLPSYDFVCVAILKQAILQVLRMVWFFAVLALKTLVFYGPQKHVLSLINDWEDVDSPLSPNKPECYMLPEARYLGLPLKILLYKSSVVLVRTVFMFRF